MLAFNPLYYFDMFEFNHLAQTYITNKWQSQNPNASLIPPFLGVLCLTCFQQAFTPNIFLGIMKSERINNSVSHFKVSIVK